MPKPSKILARAQRDEPEAFATNTWWFVAPFMRRGPVETVLRLLEQEEITRAKALELIEAAAKGHRMPSAPWGELNWGEPNPCEEGGQ